MTLLDALGILVVGILGGAAGTVMLALYLAGRDE